MTVLITMLLVKKAKIILNVEINMLRPVEQAHL